MQGSSGAPQDNTEKRISDDAAKTLQNILNAVRTSLEDEFAIQQMEYDEVYGVESEEFERYQVQVADWLRENRLVDAVVDMLPLSCFMNSPAPAQQAAPDPQSQEPDQQQPQYQDPQYQEAQPEPAPLQAPVHSYDEQSTSHVNMQPPPTSAEAPIPPAFAPPPPPEPQPAAAVAQSAGWPEQPWGPPPGRPAEPEQQSSQGNPWAQSDDDSGWYTGAAPGETTQTQDAVQSDGASQWTQPQWNSSVEASDSREGGFESGGWAAVQEESAPEPELAPVQYADTASPFAAPAPAQPPAPATGWAALEPAQDPSPAPAQASGRAAPESAPVSAPESAPVSAQASGWAAPESASAQEPAPTPTWPAAPESEPAPSWPPAPAPAPAPVPEPQPETAPVFQSIPAPSADQSVQQQPAPAPVPDPRKREESEEDYTYDPTTAWG